MDPLLSRKFIFALLSVFVAGVFVVAGKLSATDWTSFVTLIGGIYVLGNLGDAYIAKKPTETTGTVVKTYIPPINSIDTITQP